MIYSVNGEIICIEPNLAVVECGGVGYACRTTANTLSRLKIGDDVKLLTYLNVREDAVELFGFGDKRELSAFKMLISVSGVGPKAALAILSDLSPQDFALCIVDGDAKRLTRAPGIGLKIAQRIILELKDKIEKQMGVSGKPGVNALPDGNLDSQKIKSNVQEAVSALMVLGFSAAQAANALEDPDRNLPTAELIKAALKKL